MSANFTVMHIVWNCKIFLDHNVWMGHEEKQENEHLALMGNDILFHEFIVCMFHVKEDVTS